MVDRQGNSVHYLVNSWIEELKLISNTMENIKDDDIKWMNNSLQSVINDLRDHLTVEQADETNFLYIEGHDRDFSRILHLYPEGWGRERGCGFTVHHNRLVIFLSSRNGGGNRECCAVALNRGVRDSPTESETDAFCHCFACVQTKLLPMNKYYITDWDDDGDNTYANTIFHIPERAQKECLSWLKDAYTKHCANWEIFRVKYPETWGKAQSGLESWHGKWGNVFDYCLKNAGITMA